MASIDLVLFTVTGVSASMMMIGQAGDGEAVVRPDGVEAGQDQPEQLEERVEDLADQLEQGILGQEGVAQHGRPAFMGVDPDRDQVHAVGPEGPAAQQAAGRQGEAPPEAVGA